MCRGVLARALGGLLRCPQGVLELLLLLCLREPPRCCGRAGHAQQTLRGVRSRAALDLDLEVPKGHVVTLLLSLGSGRRLLLLLLFLRLAVCLPLSLLLRVALLVEPVEALPAETGAGDLRLPRLDLLEEA